MKGEAHSPGKKIINYSGTVVDVRNLSGDNSKGRPDRDEEDENEKLLIFMRRWLES